MFPDVWTVTDEEVKMLLPSFCQLKSIGGKSDEVIDIAGIKSDEAAQVELASDPDFTFAATGFWVMVGGPDERKECSHQYKKKIN